MKQKFECKALITQSINSITVATGEIPIIPDSSMSRDLHPHDLKVMAVNFMRSGCPGVQILFHGLDKTGHSDTTPDVEIVKKHWGEFLQLVQLPGEEFHFGEPTGELVTKLYDDSPYNMSILLTRHVK